MTHPTHVFKEGDKVEYIGGGDVLFQGEEYVTEDLLNSTAPVYIKLKGINSWWKVGQFIPLRKSTTVKNILDNL